MWGSALFAALLIMLTKKYTDGIEPDIAQTTFKHRISLLRMWVLRIAIPLIVATFMDILINISDTFGALAGLSIILMWFGGQLSSLYVIKKFASLKSKKHMNELRFHCILATIPEVYLVVSVLPSVLLMI